MDISVIVPFLNEEPYIERCVRSLLEQDFEKDKYEVIFVNNGSTDRSRGIVEKYPGVVLLDEPRKSDYKARNKALKIAKGEIIAFTDADCEVSKDWLRSIRHGIKSDGSLFILGKRFLLPGSPLALRLFQDYENAKIEYIVNFCEKKNFFAFTNNMAVSSDVFRKIGLFSEAYIAADTEFMHRFLEHYPKEKVGFVSGMKMTHLEIRCLGNWYNKTRIYGKCNKIIEEDLNLTGLNSRERLKVFSYCIKKNGYTFMQSVYFYCLLMVGSIYYKIGRLLK